MARRCESSLLLFFLLFLFFSLKHLQDNAAWGRQPSWDISPQMGANHQGHRNWKIHTMRIVRQANCRHRSALLSMGLIIVLFMGVCLGSLLGGSQVYMLQVITSLTTTSLCLLSFVFQMCVSILPCIFSFVFHSRHAVTLIFSMLVPRAAIVSSCTMWTFVSPQQICERLLLHGQHLWQCFQVADGDRAELQHEFPLLEAQTTAGQVFILGHG